jgi:hypothetical protein
VQLLIGFIKQLMPLLHIHTWPVDEVTLPNSKACAVAAAGMVLLRDSALPLIAVTT